MTTVTHGIITSHPKLDLETDVTLTINITGLSETYEVYGESILWPDHQMSFALGTILTDIVPVITGYTLSPLSVTTITMDSDKTLNFAASPVSSESDYMADFIPLAIDNGLIAFNPNAIEDNGDGTYTASDTFNLKVTTKYAATNGDMWAIRIVGDEDCSFGLVDRYEARDLYGIGVYQGFLYMQSGSDYDDWTAAESVAPGDWLIIRYNVSGSTKTFTPFKSTDGTTLTALTPPYTMVFNDFAGGTVYVAFSAERETTISYPQGKNLTLTL